MRTEYVLAFLLGILLFFGVFKAFSSLGRASERSKEPAWQEFTLSDGTRCVAIGEKALVCDFQRQER